MVRKSIRRSTAAEITRGIGNVFADLGMPDSEERQTKLRLAYALNGLMDRVRPSQAEVAARLGLTQAKASALRSFRLEGFSVERLMTLLNALDQDVESRLRKEKPRSRVAAR